MPEIPIGAIWSRKLLRHSRGRILRCPRSSGGVSTSTEMPLRHWPWATLPTPTMTSPPGSTLRSWTSGTACLQIFPMRLRSAGCREHFPSEQTSPAMSRFSTMRPIRRAAPRARFQPAATRRRHWSLGRTRFRSRRRSGQIGCTTNTGISVHYSLPSKMAGPVPMRLPNGLMTTHPKLSRKQFGWGLPTVKQVSRT